MPCLPHDGRLTQAPAATMNQWCEYLTNSISHERGTKANTLGWKPCH
jgi:hypothetical protein